MEMSSLCLVLASLVVTPDSSQFFRYDRILLSCAANASGWTVRRAGSAAGAGPCTPRGAACTIEDAYESDSGVYWCQSPRGACSNKINLTVTAGAVILQVPQRGATEGDNVTLRCVYKKEEAPPTSNFQAAFLKDDWLIGTEEGGAMTLRGVSKASEGLYACRHPSGEKSLQSWLLVRERPSPAPPTAVAPPDNLWLRVLCGALLFLLYNALLVFCLYTYCRWRRGRK